MPCAIVKLVASLQIAAHIVEEGDQWEFHLEPSVLPREGKKASRRATAYVSGVFVCSEPYGSEDVKVCFWPPDKVG